MLQFFRRASQVVPNGTRPPQLSCLSGQWFLTDVSKLVLKVLKHSRKWREEGAGRAIFVIGGRIFELTLEASGRRVCIAIATHPTIKRQNLIYLLAS